MLAGIERALTPIAPVRLAYVFGSRVLGSEHAESDLDLAVLFDPALDARGRFDARLRIVEALTEALGALGERVDVVDLHDPDPAVAFKAIQGHRVVCRDDRERRMLEVRVARRYDDDAPRRALYRRAAKARWGAP